MIASQIEWPEGKRFAFTVFDDTDLQTLENTPPVYELLHDLGFRTTKSVWPIRGSEEPKLGGSTCEEAGYLDWVRDLQRRGFEIGLHNVTYHTSPRPEIERGIERFRELFGHYPRSHANHYGCHDAIYWGDARLTGMQRSAYRLLMSLKGNTRFGGHVESSPLFWGDLCQQRIDYVRNFTYAGMNTLKSCPIMPYHDPHRPYVNHWFASSDGAEVNSFVRVISESAQDQLEDEGGACIMYTHFGFSFYLNGELDPRFKRLMERLSRKNGWFVPVSELLDFLLKTNGRHEITNAERTRLERQWLLHRIRTRGTT
jgi:hypothetical protein